MTVKFNKMKPGLAAGIGRVQAFWREGKYQQALNEVNDLIRNWADNPRLLVMRACLIQLQDNESGPSLEDACAGRSRRSAAKPGPVAYKRKYALCHA